MRRLSQPFLWFSVSLFAFYMVLVLARPQGVFWSLDEGGKLLYIQNVLQRASATAPLIYPGRTLDPSLEYLPLFFYARQGSEIYSWWPVGFPLLTLPFYRLLGWAGLYVLPALAGAAASALSALIAVRLAPALFASNRTRQVVLLMTAALVGLATPMLFYSTMFWEHTLSVALLLLGLWLALRSGQDNCGWCAIAAGAAVGFAGFLRTEQLFAGLGILAVLTLWRWRHGVRMGVSLAVLTAAWMAFNYAMMGSWISRQWGANTSELTNALFPGLTEAGLLYIPYLLFNAPKIIAYDLGTPLLVLGTLLVAACLILPAVRRLWPLLAACYAGLAAVCAVVLFQPEGYRSVHGVVLIAPQIVCFAWLYYMLRRKDVARWPVAMLSAAALVVLLAFVARSWLAAGGQQWGSRYLLVLYPLLTIAAVVGLFPLAHSPRGGAVRFLLAAAAVLVLIGAGFQVRGQQAVWTTVQNYRLTQAALEKTDLTPKLTDCIWLPMVIPELYWRGDFYARTNGQDPAAWQASIRSLGAAAGEWLDMDMCMPEPLDQVQRLRQANPTGVDLRSIDGTQ
ncbi:MAG: hypothetical protein U0X20_25640 [Caldilineaceae bacterium]